MRVLQINATYGTGSTGMIVEHIKKALDEQGIENWIACQYTNTNEQNVFGISNKLDIKVHALLSRITGTNAHFSRFVTRKFLMKIDQIQPDIVHLHNLHNNFINLNMLLEYLEEKDIKTVLTLHDCWLFTGKCTHFTLVGCDRWKTGCGECVQLRRDIPSWHFDKTGQMWIEKQSRFEKIRQLEVVGCSEWIASLAEQSLLYKGNITTIHNGIDVELFSAIGPDYRTELGIEGKFVILGMANKWFSKENKGLLQSIENSFAEECHIIIVGMKGTNTPIVTYLEYISNPQNLACIYRTADVFVNVTYEDTLPTVNLEAMACGVPVITYDSCGSGETIEEGTGYVVRQGDVNTLLESLHLLHLNGKKFYSAACRKNIEQNYNCKIQYQKYIDIYRGK